MQTIMMLAEFYKTDLHGLDLKMDNSCNELSIATCHKFVMPDTLLTMQSWDIILIIGLLEVEQQIHDGNY